MENISTEMQEKRSKPWYTSLLFLTLAALVIGWLYFAPPGLLGKADAVGYAVCHRIDHRSFHIGERAVPLCARCSGMFLGALLALAYQMALGRRRTGLPPKSIQITLIIFALFWAFDGGNSYLQYILGRGPLYTTTNTIRMIAGTGMGLAIGAILLPAFNQTAWQRYSDKPALENWRQFGGLLALGAVLVLAVLSENPLILYPLSLLSAVGVILTQSLLYAMVMMMVLKRENTLEENRDLVLLLAIGLIFSFIQIIAFDIGRFTLTGTWEGFPSQFGG